MRNWLAKIHRRVAELPRFSGLSDALLFIRILLFATATPALLRLKLPTLRSLLEPKRLLQHAEPSQIEQIVEQVDTAIHFGRPLIRSSCLTRGLTLYYFLSRAGIDVALQFGMGRINDNYAGHCWLVKNGEPFMEDHDPRGLFHETYCFPAKG